jgi:sortase A
VTTTRTAGGAGGHPWPSSPGLGHGRRRRYAESQPPGGVGPVRMAVRVLADLLITAGLVVLLFLGYQLFYSNIDATRAQERVTAELQRRWAAPMPRKEAAMPTPVPAPALGEAFARVHIPRLGQDWARPIIEGVGPKDLAKGVGHYPNTALPGRVGNFALAGHRATHGEPLRDLDRLRKGDAVVVETRDTWYVYTVDVSRIVLPTQVDVVAPVPGRPGVRPTERLLTLSTCHPRWASYQRLIVHGHLTGTMPKSKGMPSVLREG